MGDSRGRGGSPTWIVQASMGAGLNHYAELMEGPRVFSGRREGDTNGST